MLENKRIGFLGAGNMAEALIKGILRAKLIPRDCLLASDIKRERLEYIRDLTGIEIVENNIDLIKRVDTFILAVKPQVLARVLPEIASSYEGRKLVISIAAGIPIKYIEDSLSREAPIIRVMPNTPVLIGEGMSAIAANRYVRREEEEEASLIFQSVGKVVSVPEELMDAVTGLSGSGPAYVFLIIEALTDAGVKMGLKRDLSLLLACQTVLGAAKMVLETGEHPAVLKDKVTSPGGTTINALSILEERGMRGALLAAVEAATKRARELSR